MWRGSLQQLMGRMLPLLLVLTLAAGCRSYSAKSVVSRFDIEYARPAGKPLLLDIYTPVDATNSLPVLVWIHGGSWKAGSKKPCPLVFLTQAGAAVVSIDYRLIADGPFPAQLHDCKGAIRWLKAHASEFNLDPARIAVFGASAGGHLAALLGTTSDVPWMEGAVGGNLQHSSRVQAICAFYPPTDLNLLITDPEERRSPVSDIGRFLGGPLESNLDKAARASPMKYITPDDAPFYILHGAKDRMVPLAQGIALHEALLEKGVESSLYIVPNKGHAIGAPAEASREIKAFLDRHLGLEKFTSDQRSPAGR